MGGGDRTAEIHQGSACVGCCRHVQGPGPLQPDTGFSASPLFPLCCCLFLASPKTAEFALSWIPYPYLAGLVGVQAHFLEICVRMPGYLSTKILCFFRIFN